MGMSSIRFPGNNWKVKHTIGDFKMARGIAVDKKGNFAVTDTMQKKVLLYKADCRETKPQTLLHAHNDQQLITKAIHDSALPVNVDPRDVCLTSRHQAVAILLPRYYYRPDIKLLAIEYQGDYSKFPSSLTKYASIDHSEPSCLTIESGIIYVGSDSKVDMYKANGFEHVDTITITGVPRFIACTKRDPKNRKVLVTHSNFGIQGYNGDKELFTVIPSIDGSKARAYGIACDENDNVYVGVSLMEENTGHIHKYSLNHEPGSPPKYSLVFQECIAQGLLQPQGMDYANRCLYVVDTNSVLIFGPKVVEQQVSQQ